MAVSPLSIFLVDEDPVFRLGLRIWLDHHPDFQVIGEASAAATALDQLAELQATAVATRTDAATAAPAPAVDGVILDLGLAEGDPVSLKGFQLCRDIKQRFPQLPVIVLSAYGEPVVEAAARQMGADGFGQRGLPIRALARLIQQTVTQSLQLSDPDQDVAIPELPLGIAASLRHRSLQQIEAAVAAIEQAAAQRHAYWYRLVLAGQHRELRAARWLILRIWPLSQERTKAETADLTAENPTGTGAAIGSDTLPVGTNSGAIARTESSLPVAVADVRTRVCEAVFRKLQFRLENRSSVPLEIDILRPEKSRELLYTLLRTFESLLDDLQQAAVPPGQLALQAPDFLRDLWKTAVIDFFGRYYTPAVDGLEQPLVVVLQQDMETVQTAILHAIPEVPALLGHLLFQSPLEVDGASYGATTPEALRRSQFLLENLLIQVACGVMQPVLNRFADVESLKRSLYQRRILSTRDITRFRNELSWRYRWDALVSEPKAIFESQYRLFALTPQGIQVQWIYAPRKEELESLSGVPYWLTLALETRDAIAPRLRTTVSFVGSGFVFVLTEVVGRGIGLVGRGIAKGIGNAWHDIRFRQRRDEL